MNLIEDIKERGSIIQLAESLGMQVNSSGFTNSIYKEDKTPSMKLYQETNSFYCFATNQGGDIIKFYEDFKRLNTKEAVKELAEWLNIGNSLNRQNHTRPKLNFNREREFKTVYNAELKLLDSEKEFFQERKAILESETGLNEDQIKNSIYEMILDQRKEIQSNIFEQLYSFNKDRGLDRLIYTYLKGDQRKLTDYTIKAFKLFSIHSIKENIEFLKDTFERDELIISGLFKNKYFLFTKHRLIIPYIEDSKISYLRGRYFYSGNSKPETFGKYIGLNNWSGTLSPKRFYNIDILRSLKPFSDLVISEGEFDTMITIQNNISALGIAGVSNFPKDQINLLNRFNIYLAFDSDEAGNKAVNEISKLFYRPIKQIIIKNYKDLTELFK